MAMDSFWERQTSTGWKTKNKKKHEINKCKSCAKLGVCWAYLAAISTSTAWATRRNFTLYKVKFDMTHFLV